MSSAATSQRSTASSSPDLYQLVPGSRIRLRDWRDGSLVDGTFIGFIARAPMRIGPNTTVRLGQRFGRLGDGYPNVDVVAYRDCFCGDRVFSARDVVEILPIGTLLERARYLAKMIESLARDCAGCRAFVEDQARTGERHDRQPEHCPGLTLIPELAACLAEIRRG